MREGRARAGSATGTRRSSTSSRKYGSSAAFVPAGLLILCRGSAANPVASPVSTCDRRIAEPTTIYVAAGHMHLLGASIKLELNPGTPRAKVLLDIPRWDFHWQNAYTLANPVEGGARRRRARHLPPRRHASARTAGTASRRRRATSSGERARRTRCASGSCRSRAGRAAADPPRLPDVPGARRPGPRGLRREPRARARRPGPRARTRGGRLARRREARATSRLFRDASRVARRFGPDVVYAHFLVPAGLVAALAGDDAPLVVTAHGQDVANIGVIPGVRAATRHVVRRAATVIAVSDWLREQLVAAVPEARTRRRSSTAASTSSASHLAMPRPRAASSAGAAQGTAFLCLGTLSERKNVLRLARAFEQRGEGTLTFVGDGPLREALEGAAGNPARRPRRARRRADVDRRRPTSSASRACRSRSASRRSRRWRARDRSSPPRSAARPSS